MRERASARPYVLHLGKECGVGVRVFLQSVKHMDVDDVVWMNQKVRAGFAAITGR